MVRQFLWGQRFTRKYFGYTSNCFWLPDTWLQRRDPSDNEGLRR